MHHLVGIPCLLNSRLGEMSPHDRLQAQIENLELFAADVLPAFL